jgi:hypothetical protein
MEKWVDEVVSKWKNEGVKVNEHTSIASIQSAEFALGFKFPDDFKDLYLQINGFKDLDWQEHMFYFWPIERIIEEFEESLDKNFIGFCDFLLASHYIGFKKNQTGIFKMYSICRLAEADPISQSFSEVVTMINSSSDLIY